MALKTIIRSDKKKEILGKTSEIFDNGKIILVSGFLRFFKTTSVLDWAFKQDKKVVYVVRTNKTVDESVDKNLKKMLDKGKRVVTLRGKDKICPKIFEKLKDDEEVSYEALKVKYCMKCPYRPSKHNPLTADLRQSIDQEKIIDKETLEFYYNNKVCPSEVALYAAKSCDIVFMTYAWLHFIKDIGKGELKRVFDGSITIFDEARHLVNFGVSQENIGERIGGKFKSRKIDTVNKFVNWFTPLFKRIKKRKGNNDYNRVQYDQAMCLQECISYYKQLILTKVTGWVSDLTRLDVEEVKNAIFLMEKLMVEEPLNKKEFKLCEEILVILTWIKKNVESELFIDFNKKLFLDDEDDVYLTARAPKEKLVDIIEESEKVFLVDSTPPLTDWSEFWLGKSFDIEEVIILPKTKPRIRFWVENSDRRTTHMLKWDNVMDAEYAFVNKCLFSDTGKWVVSTRSITEAYYMGYAELFGHKVTYQGGSESEGVQLEGNHVVTGFQHIYPKHFESQKKYVLKKLGYKTSNSRFWRRYLLFQTFQSMIQQMFRTFYHDGSVNVVLLGVRWSVVKKMVDFFPYLDVVDFSVMKLGGLRYDKLSFLQDFLDGGSCVESDVDYLKKVILKRFPFNSVGRTVVYKSFGMSQMKRVKEALDDLNWKGSRGV